MFLKLLTHGKYQSWGSILGVVKTWGDANYELLTMHSGFQPKSNVERLYLLRSEGGRGLIGVQDTAETAILALKDYVRNSKDRLLIAAHTKEDN